MYSGSPNKNQISHIFQIIWCNWEQLIVDYPDQSRFIPIKYSMIVVIISMSNRLKFYKAFSSLNNALIDQNYTGMYTQNVSLVPKYFFVSLLSFFRILSMSIELPCSTSKYSKAVSYEASPYRKPFYMVPMHQIVFSLPYVCSLFKQKNLTRDGIAHSRI